MQWNAFSKKKHQLPHCTFNSLIRSIIVLFFSNVRTHSLIFLRWRNGRCCFKQLLLIKNVILYILEYCTASRRTGRSVRYGDTCLTAHFEICKQTMATIRFSELLLSCTHYYYTNTTDGDCCSVLPYTYCTLLRSRYIKPCRTGLIIIIMWTRNYKTYISVIRISCRRTVTNIVTYRDKSISFSY